LVVAFSFLKSTQNLNFPFIFGATTINDSHVTFSTSYMKPFVNSLPMFCFITPM
jgi:hypothetical protein